MIEATAVEVHVCKADAAAPSRNECTAAELPAVQPCGGMSRFQCARTRAGGLVHVQLPTRLAVGTGTGAGAGTGASTGTDGTADERRQPSIVLVDTDCVARPIGNQSINCRASTREIALALALTQPFM